MRILALFCGAFSAGIFAAQYLLPGAYLLDLGAGAFLLACLRFLFPGDAGKRLLLIGTGLSLAFGYYWLYSRQTVDSLTGLYGAERDAVMTLCEYAEPTAWGARASVEINGLPGKVAYYGGRELLELQPGAAIRAIVRLEDARRVHDSDITTFTSRGIFTLVYGRGNAEIVRESGGVSVRYWPMRTGHALQARIRETFPGDVAPFLSALLTGDRTGLSVAADVDIAEAGLSHVLAVSGMHCGFLVALITFLLRRRRVQATAAGILCLIFYALMTGAKPSVVRACIMLSLLLLAPLFQRENDAPTTLSAALFVILLQNPFAAASISLQLSFASVAGLLCLTPNLYALLSGDAPRYRTEYDSEPDAARDDSGADETKENARRWLARIRNVIAATFAASIGVIAFTAPLCAVYFGVLALIAPLSNLLCLWAVGAAFVTGFAVTIVSFLPIPVAALLAWIPALLVRYILLCAHVLAKLPLHAVYFANPPLKYWLVYAYALFALTYL
ncbi:MAG: ComEC/Rec2 family competence protein, partial [Oscillibacter sp.]|nr:ComEC/Rec2 family competence protein [Oscillibacter sp.]